MIKTKIKFAVIWFLLFVPAIYSNAQIHLPSIVSDGMILQCDQKVKIWG